MATNKVQDGKIVQIAKSSVSSGDPVEQNDLTGVALTDTDSDGNIQLATEGVFELSVKGEDNSGNKAVSLGDKLYYDSAATPKINKDATNGTLFGKALGTVGSGSTATIDVLLVQA